MKKIVKYKQAGTAGLMVVNYSPDREINKTGLIRTR